VLVGCLVLAPAFASSADPALETTGAAPETLGAARAVLPAEGVRVSGVAGGPIDLWLRHELPAAKGEAGALGVRFGTLPKGALVGAVRFAADWIDYKGERVASGVYTLRYAVEPADGNHMGVSTYRDFLLLVPAGDDPGPEATLDLDRLIALSRKATGSSHPAVLALFPPPSDAGPPALLRNDLDQPMVAVSIGGVAAGLVLEGQGEGARY
jgi:hypothetical protein